MKQGMGARVLGAVVFTALCVVLAAVGHVMMSGQPLPVWSVVTALGVAIVGAWPLTRTERPLWVVTAAAVALQSVLHLAFSVAPVTSGATEARPHQPDVRALAAQLLCNEATENLSVREAHRVVSEAGLGHHHAGSGEHGGAAPVMPMGYHGEHGGAPWAEWWAHLTHVSSPGMVGAHVLAAVLCGLWLAYGQRAVFQILRAFSGWLFGPLRFLVAVIRPVSVPCWVGFRNLERGSSLARLSLAHSIVSRGPPTVVAVF